MIRKRDRSFYWYLHSHSLFHDWQLDDINGMLAGVSALQWCATFARWSTSRCEYDCKVTQVISQYVASFKMSSCELCITWVIWSFLRQTRIHACLLANSHIHMHTHAHTLALPARIARTARMHCTHALHALHCTQCTHARAVFSSLCMLIDI